MRIGFLAAAMGMVAGLNVALVASAAFAEDSASAPSPAQALSAGPFPAGWTLKGAVLLSRHGLRGPTYAVNCDQAGGNPNNCLDAVGTRPWPNLGVIAGDLLPEGYERVRAMGRFYRLRYAETGLLPQSGCPDPKTVAFFADTDERVVMTAGAVMSGMFPGCALTDLAVHGDIYKGPTCGYTKADADQAAQAFVGGSWAKVAKGELAGPIAAMDKIIGPLKPDVCTALGVKTPCSVADVPTTDADPGVINFLSQPTEQLIMQYGSGRAPSEVGWGRVSEATGKPIAEAISYVNDIHALNDWVANATPYIADHKGSPVLDLIVSNLTEIANSDGATFRFLSSHDNYILHVGGMLGLDWQLPSYPRHQVPLGGSIAFELWQPPTGEPVVRLVYAAQSIEQLHANPDLTLTAPPGLEVLPVKSCAASPGGSCAWSDFRAIADRSIIKACVGKP